MSPNRLAPARHQPRRQQLIALARVDIAVRDAFRFGPAGHHQLYSPTPLTIESYHHFGAHQLAIKICWIQDGDIDGHGEAR